MSPRPDVSKERKKQITEAATTVFSRQGFQKSRISDIASEAGLSKGTLYLYFKSKDEIIVSLLANLFDREFSYLHELKDNSLPAADRLLEYSRNLSKSLIKWERLIPILFEFASRISRQNVVQQAFKTYFHTYLEMLSPIIQQGIDSGEFKSNNTQEIASTLCAIFEGTILLWIYDREYFNLQSQVYTSIQLLLEGIKV